MLAEICQAISDEQSIMLLASGTIMKSRLCLSLMASLYSPSRIVSHKISTRSFYQVSLIHVGVVTRAGPGTASTFGLSSFWQSGQRLLY